MWSDLSGICKNNSIDLSEEQADQLKSFQEKILEWNKKINLVSRRDESNFAVQHIVSSISLLSQFHFLDHCKIVDLGTGGGLPGIPLAILHPEMQFVLIDSIQKKINTVQDIVSALCLQNVQIVCGRAEELSQVEEFHEKFDYVISRAVASINDLIRWGKPFLKKNVLSPEMPIDKTSKKEISSGSIIMLKGGDLMQEIEQAKIKSKPKQITVQPLVLNGVVELYDKKIVIVVP